MRSQKDLHLLQSLRAFGAAFSRQSEKPLRHALGFASELRRRCVNGNEPAYMFAEDKQLWANQVEGAIRLLRNGNWSPERLACVVMLDPGFDDRDVAEIFGRSVRWARVVRAQRDEICAEEQIPDNLQWIDDGLQPDYPSPEEIARRAAELRASRPRAFMERAESPYEVPEYAWRDTHAKFPHRVA